MPYLVDGNNLMRRGQTRKELLEELAQFAAAKKVRISVVFDGAPENNFPDGSTFKGVKVFYSKYGSNADERIKKFIESSKERRTLFVITDDRALSDYVRRSSAKVIKCGEFREKMTDITSQEAEQIHSEEVRPKELAEWMRYFGVDETDE
jgi:predicted RNA-binding protein with PIN domain